MDEIVRQGLAKWPNVPDCFGWLALDARGRWRIGEARQVITHRPTLGFIGRNYASDAQGQWLFQNGPQRVYVELEYTPYIFRLQPSPGGVRLVDHVGSEWMHPNAVWIDDAGQFLVQCEDRIGALHDHDSALLLEYACGGDGSALSDRAIEDHIEAALAGGVGASASSPLALRWPGSAAPLLVTPIRRDLVAHRFSFQPHPASPRKET